MTFERVMNDAVMVFESIGVIILVVGSFLALGGYLVDLLRRMPAPKAFDTLRGHLGRSILLGLEVLVVADIVRTIVVTPTLQSAATLGLIVVVRIALSFAIDVEVDGVAPWRKAEASPVDPEAG